VDVLANPSLQRWLPIVLAVIAALGMLTFLGALWTARRQTSPQARVFRKRVGAVSLFVVVAATAAFALLATPVDSETARRPVAAATEADAEGEVRSANRFSSAKLPALSLDAPAGWRLELDAAGRKLSANSDSARLLVSTAILTEAVDVESLLQRMAETQRTLGFEVSATFTDRLGDLPAAGFVATGPARSVCVWMVRRDTHLASSVICTADGKLSARQACRGPLATIRWRAPGRP
jgi:hypothetical protein